MKMVNKMKRSQSFLGRRVRQTLVLSVSGLFIGGSAFAGDPPKASGDLVPLDLKLPQPAIKGTPKDQTFGPIVEPLSDKPRPAMMVPSGVKNVAAGKKVTSSDKNTPADVLAKITDGDKEATDQSIIFLRKGTQWVQIDLGAPAELFAIVIWHAHNTAKG